jgi:CTD kinase subunit beta
MRRPIVEIAHEVIDLFAQVAQSPTSGAPSANTSPSTPSSPPRHVSSSSQSHSQHQRPIQHPATNLPFKSDQLMRLKIAMRDREAERPPRPQLKTHRPGYPITGLTPNPYNNQSSGYGQGNGHLGEPGGDPALNEGLGRNEGTVRFLFGADWD